MQKLKCLVETYTKANYNWPGTKENPMKSVMYKHPITGDEQCAHYNDKVLFDDKDYESAGFERVKDYGWCWPVIIEGVYWKFINKVPEVSILPNQ